MHKILAIAVLVTLFLLGGMIYFESLKERIPSYVTKRRRQLERAITPESLNALQRRLPVEPMTRPSEILSIVGKNLIYADPKDPSEANTKLGELRSLINRSDPITILDYGVGRCEEFSIVYAALCKNAGFDVRVVWDFSIGTSAAGVENGDHVWVEVNWLPERHSAEDIMKWAQDKEFWCHTEVVQGAIWASERIITEWGENPYINEPMLYERDWEKDVKEAWGIWTDSQVRVTGRYQFR